MSSSVDGLIGGSRMEGIFRLIFEREIREMVRECVCVLCVCVCVCCVCVLCVCVVCVCVCVLCVCVVCVCVCAVASDVANTIAGGIT